MQHRAQRREEFGPAPPQLVPMLERKPPEERLGPRREGEQHLPAILTPRRPPDETLAGQPVDQAHRAVVAELEVPGEGADGRGPFRWKGLEGQQPLSLLRGQPRLPRRLRAEGEESPDEVAELREREVVARRQ